MKIRGRRAPTDFGASGDEARLAANAEPAREAVTEPLVAPVTEAVPPLEPPRAGAEVTASGARPPARRPQSLGEGPAPAEVRAPPAWPIYLTALAVSVLWAVAPIAFAVGYRSNVAPLTDDVFALAVFALLAIGPAAFVWGAAYMIRQGQKLSAEARRAKAMAEDMLAPALSAAARAGHVVQGVRDEIAAAGLAADQARETLLALRQAMAEETLKLTDATRTSVRTAQDLAGALGKERTEIGALAESLDARAAQVADVIGEHARRVVDATDAAGARLKSAEAEIAETLESRAAQMADIVGEQARRVVEATDTAGARLKAAEAEIAETLESRTARMSETIDGQARRVLQAADEAANRLKTTEAELAETLDARAAKVTEAIGSQARMVAEAADVAETQLREAEAVLAARAADLAAAAGEVGDAARTAGEDLTRHIARLETAGTGVADQIRAVEGGLSDHRAALITLSQALRADHQGFAAEAQTHAETLAEFISQARLSAAEMSERATRGSETLKALMADAAEQFRDLAETARAEREEFGQSTLQSLDAVSQAAAEQRAQLEAQTRAAIDALAKAAEETREAAASHAATAREQVDQLSEAAFTAGQKANQVFEARLAEARALVEQSSQMVEQAGVATAKKLDEGAAAARATLAELGAMLGELEERAQRLPAAARGQAEQVRETVVQGMDELMEAARRTAEEAQAIDAAFQERVRRNFEMLSEAVRLMGSVAATPPAPLTAAAPARPATPPPTFSASAAFTPTPRPVRARTPEPAPPAPEPEPPAIEPEVVEAAAEAPPLEAVEPEDLVLDEIAEPTPRPAKGKAKDEPEKASGTPLAARLGLRPRLKLTPTATDEEFSQVFESAAGRPVPEPKAEGDGEGWTWKDLLSSIDGGSAEGEALEQTLGAELAKMGVDPEKLLPKPRIDEIAAAVQVGDLDGARQVVKRLAPAATRRIVRRLFTDEALRGQVTGYIRRYQGLVDDAVVRDPEGFLMAELLGAEAGRLYLLLDAAVGDMA
ncbi:polar localization protein TipN [Phenylobacterium sp.]|uniref:polar localization protein TipN n=1 Tax=Phenylobacterium sp. TaxID=1871053 RepID=UPI002C63270B|nr:polar localization protein TipN [Phenylobacterium sp.]HVI33921.1 polar localization protein TipN [Phenylobacterium sp.]